MKVKTLFTLLVLSLLPLVCSAEILIYKGSVRGKVAGGFNKWDYHGRLFLVHDTGNGVTTQIYYETRSREKRYYIRDITSRAGIIHSTNGVSFTLLSEINSGGDVDGPQAVWIKGRNTTLKTSESTAKIFPRILTIQTKEFDSLTIDGNESIAVAEGVGICVFQSAQTIAANQAGYSRDPVIDGIRIKLEALGYVDNSYTPPK
jgi:hypothetical protein